MLRTSRKDRNVLSKSRVFTVNWWPFRRFGAFVQDVDLSKISWKDAEELAVKHLQSEGYKVIGRNVRTPFGEIDIIALKRGMYVFVEVKSGHSKRINPAERVDRVKYTKILNAAEYYISNFPKRKFRSARVDVIEVTDDGIKHYENVGWEYR